ncbi:DNA end-binding protein Ku [Variovorax sp. TBS-050B]|uniref:non-homologous end joining protein Ku n=1 Tax=Variovorax sp. TBS-050B TaxID=2940551 RepID=UPI0024747846|nr:Ku protein [Variovorax sp. TBS-050B]MDH6592530.1 DNA end-binding protein Ku [Variovorax sp. TBS-050B]
MAVSKKASAPRVLWKGAISFGLVHIPVALYSATSSQGIDFDWLDKRTMDPVGYKRINKKTGKEIARENIVKGIEYEDGEYVVLSPKEIEDAYPKTTQTIEIESFVPANGIPFVYLERPYYVAPINRGTKVYALLRETLQRTGRIGVARVVIQTKQHLAALVPVGAGLVLNLLRWGADIRPWDELPLPSENAKKAGLTERELKMAEQLVEDMSGEWDPDRFKDEFKDEIMRLVERKVAAGQTETVTPIEPEESQTIENRGAKIIDLTELLQRSLRKGGGGGKQSAASRAADEDDDDEDDGEDAAPAKSKPRASAKTKGKAHGKTAAKTTASAARKRTGTTTKTAAARRRAA